MPKLNLSTKLSLFLLLICLSTSLTVGWISYINSKAILEAQTFDRLTAMQTAKTAEIERYFEQVANQIHTAAGNPNTINALVAFNSGFARLNKTPPNSTVGVNNDALEKFYRDEFLPQLVPSNPRVNANNALESAELESSLASLIPRQTAGLYLQEHYIVRNPNVSGEKHLLTRSSTDSSDYADAHETYHPGFSQLFGENSTTTTFFW
jgi:hypothetical protein